MNCNRLSILPSIGVFSFSGKLDDFVFYFQEFEEVQFTLFSENHSYQNYLPTTFHLIDEGERNNLFIEVCFPFLSDFWNLFLFGKYLYPLIRMLITHCLYKLIKSLAIVF